MRVFFVFGAFEGEVRPSHGGPARSSKSERRLKEMEVQKAIRQMDDLGRIIIPKDIRESLGWGTGTKLEVVINDIAVKSIIVREVSPCCSLCRAESDNLEKIEKGYVCAQCSARLKK